MTDRWNALITEVEPAPARPGPLAGLRLAVKDLIDTAGVRTTYGSRIYADHVPERTATAVERLVAAGAVVTAKANLHEFAWGVTSQNPWYGTVENPHLPGRTTGGSSGGNAAAIAGGLADIGLGTDTGCSIRLPATCCGLVGLKPSWGRIPVDGVYPLCPTFDTVAPLARTVREAATMWSVLAAAPAARAAARGAERGAASAAAVGRRPGAPGQRLGRGVRRAARGARAGVVEATIPEPPADTWSLFFHEAAASHRDDVSRAGRRVRRQRAGEAGARTGGRAGRRRSRALGGRRVAALPAEVDLYVAPSIGVECRPSTATSSTSACR